jgi:hypothetical protein
MILNKYTPPNLNKIFNSKYNINNGRTSFSSRYGSNYNVYEDEINDELMNDPTELE